MYDRDRDRDEWEQWLMDRIGLILPPVALVLVLVLIGVNLIRAL